MGLLGLPFLAVVAVASLAVCAAVALLWDRWPRRAQWPARAGALVLVMAVGALLAGTVVNRAFGFYATWQELTATPARAPSATARAGSDGGVEVLSPDWRERGRQRAARGEGTVLDVRIGGRRSGLDRPGLLYLPAAWFGPTRPALPLVELFHGYPGIPANYRDQLGLAGVLDREIRADRVPPVVAVVPHTYQGRASECVDAVSGERDETYLAVDVPEGVRRGFGTLPGRSLGLLGYSEGGFCAVDLALHSPARVAAAVSLSGYFTAGTDPHTRDLYRGDPGRLLRDSPLWQVRHRPGAVPPLLLVAGSDDRYCVAQARALRGALRTAALRAKVQVALVPAGGHSFATWSVALPAALDFLAQHLPGALAPALQLRPDPASATRAVAGTSAPAARRSGRGPGRSGGRRRAPAAS